MTAKAQPMTAWVDLMLTRTNLALGVFMVAIVGMIILPLPTPIVDFLLSTNITISLLLGITAIYIKSPLALSSFPAILLFTTLFRLALTISTTRLILLQANAGDVVATFGEVVVGGNVVVGMVIFLIITIVQFIVVTKGAERVAEVSARFSLDGLPGKQMSIDADLRAGTIDARQAETRRSEVQRESQLFGSMDGAMKFVKGDAIAGLIIVFINLIGGTCVGMLQMGFTFGEAMRLYATLTVGDGLVSQIPALLIALSAGIVVTRVGGAVNAGLGRDIGDQFLAQPKAMMTCGGLVMLFALVPGFSKFAFLSLGGSLLGLGYYLSRKEQTRETDSGIMGTTQGESEIENLDTDIEGLRVPSIIALELDTRLRERVDLGELNRAYLRLRHQLLEHLGVPLGRARIVCTELPEGTYRILIHQVPVLTARVDDGRLFARPDPAQAQRLGAKLNPLEHSTGALVSVPPEAVDTLREAEVECLDLTTLITRELHTAVHENLTELVGVQVTKALLQRLGRESADLAREVEGVVPLATIADVLRRLVTERVPIGSLQLIAECLLDKGPKVNDPIILTEHVRERLQRQISHQLTGDGRTLVIVGLGPEMEHAFRERLEQAQGDLLPLPPEAKQRLNDRLGEILTQETTSAERLAVLVPQDIRRFVRSATAVRWANIPVLAYQDLVSSVAVARTVQV